MHFSNCVKWSLFSDLVMYGGTWRRVLGSVGGVLGDDGNQHGIGDQCGIEGLINMALPVMYFDPLLVVDWVLGSVNCTA